jgi:signal transduction histidine kinase
MNAIALMESVYQVDLTSKENRLLQNENKLRNEQALFLLVLAIILIAFISFVLFKYFQNKNINTELKELNATKDKFFSIVAHDLKNPFSNLLGFSELLVSDYDNMSEAERKQAVSDLNASSKKLVALVENLLQWARANIGSLQYKPTNLNLLLFFKDLETVFHGSLKQKSLSVKFEIDANISALVDVDYLNLVMRNLFSNAIKFSYPNSTITLRAIDHIDDIHIEVSDNGVGIDENKQKMLFTLGENISTTGTRNEKGTGLGLILVKDLVTKWGGEIRVTSEVKKGSTFLVTIPKTKVSS